MNKKSTKRTLLTSVLSVVLCMAMLIGTTFAWFTDNVTSANNIIRSGNLDIVLEYWNGNDWKDVEGSADILSGDLWEPGYTDVAYLRLKNNGSLALKYSLGVNIISEKEGVNKDGVTFKLSDYIYFDVIDNQQPEFKDRHEAMKYATETMKISAGYTKADALAAGSDYVYLAMVVYMPTTVGNEANHDGVTVPEIDLGINVFATQDTVEKDSFDKYYDQDTAVFSVNEANEMLAEHKDVTLVNCIEPEGILYVPENYAGTLTLHNVTIASVQQVASVSTLALVETETIETKATKIVILGNVVVKATEDGMSAITGTSLEISGKGTLTAIGKGKAAFGIGGMTTVAINVKDITIDYVAGGFAYGVGKDTKYYKDAPEGGAAIGSGKDGAEITLNNVTVNKAIGGSKAAGIGARYHVGVTVNIKNSTLAYVEGGVSAAAIGGSRVSNGAAESGTTITISNSNVTAKGGAYGAGIGSGYDTHCQAKQPMCTINVDGSTINATGGKYAAGIGTGYHNAALTGEIKNSTIKATSGEKVYKSAYTSAMDIGFGVTDPTHEGVQADSYIEYNGSKLTMNDAFKGATDATTLDSALNNGEDVVLADDMSLSTKDTTASNGYGATGVSVNGGTFDGNGKTLTVTNANGTWDCAVNAKAGTIQNLTVNGAFRGIFMGGATGDVYIDNVVIDKVCYTFNSDGGNKDYGVYISNSSLNGWTSYSDVHKEVMFADCTFGQGTGGYKYAFCRPYNASVFENCVFEVGYKFDTTKTSDITFINCYYGDTLITADNAASLGHEDTTFFYNGLNGITIK